LVAEFPKDGVKSLRPPFELDFEGCDSRLQAADSVHDGLADGVRHQLAASYARHALLQRRDTALDRYVLRL
jgi:hypothetical protein